MEMDKLTMKVSLCDLNFSVIPFVFVYLYRFEYKSMS